MRNCMLQRNFEINSQICQFILIFLRERERETEGRGEGETQNPQQAPGSELSAQTLTQGSNPPNAKS